MILTDRFVYVHQPKTGGTFVTTVLEQIHGHRPEAGVVARLRRWFAGGAAAGSSLVNINQHGTCDEIPRSHQGKPIVSTIRNPYDRYVSQYEFEWWKTHPEQFCDPALIKQRYPHFPELSFAEFVDISNSLFLKVKNEKFAPAESPGRNTLQFVLYFCRNPRELFPRIDAEYLASRRYRHDMYPVVFLHTDRLNQDLYEFLLNAGYERSQIDFILTQKKVFPQKAPKRQDRPWQSYYTPELKQVVRTKERLLFELFPEFDV